MFQTLALAVKTDFFELDVPSVIGLRAAFQHNLRQDPEGMASAQNLVIFLHGVGANGADLAAFSGALQGFLPDAAFASPDAPNPFDGGGLGRQWFSVVGINTANRAQRVEQARAGFDRIVAQEIEKAGFGARPESVAFFGFSQGAIMSLDAIATGRWPIGAVVAASGRLALPPGPMTASKTPCCCSTASGMTWCRCKKLCRRTVFSRMRALRSKCAYTLNLAIPFRPMACRRRASSSPPSWRGEAAEHRRSGVREAIQGQRERCTPFGGPSLQPKPEDLFALHIDAGLKPAPGAVDADAFVPGQKRLPVSGLAQPLDHFVEQRGRPDSPAEPRRPSTFPSSSKRRSCRKSARP